MQVVGKDAQADISLVVLQPFIWAEGGDFKWTFNNAVDDAATDVNVPLKNAIQSYQTKLQWVQGVDGTLPVNLVSFTARASAQEVELNWSTVAEENSDQFVVERLSGATFTPIVTVKAKGNSSQLVHYTACDRHPLNGVNYYRLVQYDKDGKSFTYGIREAKIGLSVSSWSLFPNPASDNFSLKLPEDFDLPLNAELRSIGGKLVKQFSSLKREGEIVKFQLDQLQSQGIYLLALTGKNYKISLLLNLY